MALAQQKELNGIIEKKLAELGITLPVPAVPVASYAGYAITGNHVFISGQLPTIEGKVQFEGKVGSNVDLEDAARAARLCGLNILAQLKAACGGNLDRVSRCVKLTGFVNCIDGFADQPKVMNGASDLMADVFGDAGKHARAAVGVNALPLNVAVEVEAIFELKPAAGKSNDY